MDRDGTRAVYAVDGRSWEQGVLAPAAPVKAKALYGAGAPQFLAGLERYRYFPLSICHEVRNFRGGSIEVAFKGVSGTIDQAAGIAFDIKPNGDYLLLRANALEDNLVLLANPGWLRERLGLPVVLGPSRKAFLGALTGEPVEARDAASAAACAVAAFAGASALRVHDVAGAVRAAAVGRALAAARREGRE